MSRYLVFDSGVGGLSVVEHLRAMAPDASVSYGADCGFFPYGLKSDDELRARLPEVCAAMVREACADVLIIACNTASTLALEEVRVAVGVPVVGTVPAIKPAAMASKTQVIGVLATPGTVRRAYLAGLEKQFAPDATVIRHGSPALVELAERHVRGETLMQYAFDMAVAPLFAREHGDQIDVVVLACTHFALVRDQISQACPAGVTLIDTGEAVARQAVRVAPTTRSGSDDEPAALLTGGRANREAYRSVLSRFGFAPDTIRTVDV